MDKEVPQTIVTLGWLATYGSEEPYTLNGRLKASLMVKELSHATYVRVMLAWDGINLWDWPREPRKVEFARSDASIASS